MTKDKDLFTIDDVCRYFGLSKQTIRRRIREAKLGKSTFPRPVFGYGRKALWRAKDITAWTETGER
jgi:excisionase family DNA binding protein